MIGIDEVGRGAWAGPLLVVAARQNQSLPSSITDSKRLTKKQRENLIQVIISTCDIGEGWVMPDEIDKLGLTQAMRLGVDRALKQIKAQHDDDIIIDGSINYCDSAYNNVRCEVKADLNQPIVGAASIFAKVSRDQYMQKLGQDFPSYGFEKHVGYGTILHNQALKAFGVTKHHRLSYKPVQAFITPYSNN